MKILVSPESCEFADRLAGIIGQAVERLGLSGLVEQIEFLLDDIEADERAWIAPATDAAAGERKICVWCHPDHFCKDRGAALAFLPSDFPWELHDPFAADSAPAESQTDFFAAKAERFVYHQLQLIRDFCDGTLDPAAIPSGLSQAFEEAWAVTVDSRLRRRSLPGLTVAERRRRFYRAFSAGGLMLPQHWLIFRSLWEEDGWTQDRLIDVLSDLPPAGRLRRAGN